MRKFTLLLASLLFLNAGSQAQTGHLEFKGIPIQGTLDEFVSTLSNEGFTMLEKLDQKATMEGSFIGQSCQLTILSTLLTNETWKVIVYLPKNQKPAEVKKEYESLSTQFKNKYGDPDKHLTCLI